MNSLKPDVIKTLIDFRDKQLKLAEEYESNKQYETAFIAYWSVLENFVKAVATEYRKDLLRQSLHEWRRYLEEELDGCPKPPPSGKLRSFNLPRKDAFHKCLRFFRFDSGQFWKVMDSEGECRKKRNRIAHSAEKFSSPDKYFDLKTPTVGLISSIYAGFK